MYPPANTPRVEDAALSFSYLLPDKSPKREQQFKVSVDPITADADDNFGFNETTSFFQDASESE